MRTLLLLLVCTIGLSTAGYAQDHHGGEQQHDQQDAEAAHHGAADHHAADGEHGHGCSCEHHDDYDPGESAFHHISDANAFHIFGDIYLPLPCILYAPGHGWSVFMSSKFELGEHGNGHYALDGYVLKHGAVMRVADAGFPLNGKVALECLTETQDAEGHTEHFAMYEGQCFPLDKKTSYDAGMMGGGVTSFYDFSLTKNVFTMILVAILLFLLFRAVVRGYQKNDGKAPRGLQSFMEPIFLFIRDEVAIPFLGPKYERYLPFLMSIFFFILGLNLIGQIPIFPGSGNVTGNLSVTLVLALVAFLVTNLSGNAHYWQHIFWMPGVPAWIKVILTPVEIIGVFIKPLTLMLRLFANITAGHIVVIIFVSLIFIFGNAGESVAGAGLGGLMAVPLTLFMMAIELLVAFIQAFVFCILTASYIGAAIEEGHHEAEHH